MSTVQLHCKVENCLKNCEGKCDFLVARKVESSKQNFSLCSFLNFVCVHIQYQIILGSWKECHYVLEIEQRLKNILVKRVVGWRVEAGLGLCCSSGEPVSAAMQAILRYYLTYNGSLPSQRDCVQKSPKNTRIYKILRSLCRKAAVWLEHEVIHNQKINLHTYNELKKWY